MAHALTFRVMRMSKTALQPPGHLLLDLNTDFAMDMEAAEGLAARQQSWRETSTSDRVQLRSPLDICTLTGMLELPTSFGSLYLGEAFQSYISVNNTSKSAVTGVQCKAELETSRGKVALYDNTTSKVTLQPNGRHEFMIRHDVKEVGQHTLICSVAYTTAEGERRFLPQYFKFTSANPLSVRTKNRNVHSSTLLEACIENTTRMPLVLEYVRFDPSPTLTVQTIDPPGPAALPAESEEVSLAEYAKTFTAISPSGGALNLLYRLDAKKQAGRSGLGAPNNGMGKLDIKWRTPMGDVGRLQTQQIVASAVAAKDVELQAAELPAKALVEVPFTVGVQIVSHVERRLRHLAVAVKGETANDALLSLGQATHDLAELAPLGTADAKLQFLALKSGVQKLPDLLLLEAGVPAPLDALALSVLIE